MRAIDNNITELIIIKGIKQSGKSYNTDSVAGKHETPVSICLLFTLEIRSNSTITQE